MADGISIVTRGMLGGSGGGPSTYLEVEIDICMENTISIDLEIENEPAISLAMQMED